MSNSPSDIINKSVSFPDAEAFEKLYTLLRRKEQRLYTDEELPNLPVVPAVHPHFKEWQLRKRSCDRLIKYLDRKNKPLHILEVGCGNGWLSAQLAKNPARQVVGTDVNKQELTQATRVFRDFPNLRFMLADIRFDDPGHGNFDVIVFAASLQYFPVLEHIMQSAFKCLRAGGEVHILDTIFYKKNNVAAARQRTKDYYTNLGFPEVTGFYYHHCIEDLENFSPRILYDPGSWMNKLRKNKSPFFWVCIKKPRNSQSNP